LLASLCSTSRSSTDSTLKLSVAFSAIILALLISPYEDGDNDDENDEDERHLPSNRDHSQAQLL
jgi:hypothetical protein